MTRDYLQDFRNGDAASLLLAHIAQGIGSERFTFMEVCGGHTMAIWRHGLPGLLSEGIRLLSGPGCPVCVTPNSFLDRALALARLPEVIMVTFGDLMRVPGSTSDLQTERARGADIRAVYSVRDALPIARENPAKKVIFLGIGFETTTPTIAAALALARQEGLDNFRLLCALKTMPQALRAIAAGGKLHLQGLILPGHVTAITGASIFNFLASEFQLPCVVSGFEPLDILQSIYLLIQQARTGRAEVEIQYRRAARLQGNLRAQEFISRMFRPVETEWRGLGMIANSGLKLRDEFQEFAAESIPIEVEPVCEPAGCRCGEVISGAATPQECPLFAASCRPEHPVGACMVSEEGTCAAHYKYRCLS